MFRNSVRCLLLWSLALSVVVAEPISSKRLKIQKMHDRVLQDLYQAYPSSREQIQNAAGYAVFSSFGVNALIFAAAGGNGIAHNNFTGRDTYMKMASAGLGLGIGLKDFRAVFVFRNILAYRKFVARGWGISGQADAALKARNMGEGASVAVTTIPDVEVYQLTSSGIALQTSLQGSRYWRSRSLN